MRRIVELCPDRTETGASMNPWHPEIPEKYNFWNTKIIIWKNIGHYTYMHSWPYLCGDCHNDCRTRTTTSSHTTQLLATLLVDTIGQAAWRRTARRISSQLMDFWWWGRGRAKSWVEEKSRVELNLSLRSEESLTRSLQLDLSASWWAVEDLLSGLKFIK